MRSEAGGSGLGKSRKMLPVGVVSDDAGTGDDNRENTEDDDDAGDQVVDARRVGAAFDVRDVRRCAGRGVEGAAVEVGLVQSVGDGVLDEVVQSGSGLADRQVADVGAIGIRRSHI